MLRVFYTTVLFMCLSVGASSAGMQDPCADLPSSNAGCSAYFTMGANGVKYWGGCPSQTCPSNDCQNTMSGNRRTCECSDGSPLGNCQAKVNLNPYDEVTDWVCSKVNCANSCAKCTAPPPEGSSYPACKC